MNKIIPIVLALFLINCDSNNSKSANSAADTPSIIEKIIGSDENQNIDLDLKDKAHDELKAYTELWKGKIAANNIPSLDFSDSRITCLLLKDNNCIHQGTLSASITDPKTAPISGINDNYDSHVQRKSITTSISWESITNGEQKIEFYVEQLIFP